MAFELIAQFYELKNIKEKIEKIYSVNLCLEKRFFFILCYIYMYFFVLNY